MDPRLERSRRKAKLKRSDLSPNRRSLGGRYDTEPAPHHLDQQDRGGFEGTGAGGEKATPYRNLGDLVSICMSQQSQLSHFEAY